MVVGYQTVDVTTGFNMITPSFTGVGQTSYDLQEIKLSGEGVLGEGAENIQVVDSDGNISATYMWISKDISGAEEDGWCDDSFSLVDVSLIQGQSVLLYTEGDGVATVSGEVATSNTKTYTVTANLGFNPVGNATPVDVDIQNIKLSGDGILGEGAENIQIVDSDGNISATYMWISKDISGAEEDGWCDDSFSLVDYTIKAGMGFLLYTEGEGAVTLPTAL